MRNKNAVILIISALLIVVSVIIAVVALTGGNKKVDSKPATETESAVVTDANGDVSTTLDLAAIAAQNVTTTEQKPFTASTGKYKVATKEDPLGLRIKPSSDADRVTYVPKGETVEVIAVWEDWGYVVYGNSAGWLSMNYLEPVGGSATTVATTAAATTVQ